MEQEVLRSLGGETHRSDCVAQEDQEVEQGVLEPTESGNFPTRGKESDKRGRLQRVGCDERVEN